MRVLLALLLLVGCGPMLYGHSTTNPSMHFLLKVQNDDSIAATVTVSWWLGSTVQGSLHADLPPGGCTLFDLGNNVPDGLSVETVAWPTGFVLMTPDYAGEWLATLRYPSGQFY